MSREAAFRELETVYADLERELSELGPVCRTSGRCCRFRESGHELWTTGLEFEYLRAHRGLPEARREDVCPYLKDGLCSVRDHRMLGCRIYFCDPSYAQAMGPLYERYHRRIKDIHRREGIPYEYGELLSRLARQGEPDGDRSRAGPGGS
jgi:Fe-S-cluster containining protein